MIRLRPARPGEEESLSALCLRSKAHWGYDADFLAACRAELTLCADDLAAPGLAVAERAGLVVGLVQIASAGEDADLAKLFVEPQAMGQGVGRVLFAWALERAREAGARRLRVEADPDAAPFYERMGALRIGNAPSGSIPGRRLPLLAVTL
ncbi:MAG: GNAT family N-acetyltransferase [Marivibrio sp.]|uniref:GNAT family N-acetyltransferase n=1 Tax=Marivibrio sp. TaxID=2039719 RepID=UPI0032EDFDC3